MDIFKVIFYLSFPIILYGSNDCPVSSCGSGDSRIVIRFPFKLESENPNCGYPGFNLICTKDGKTILKLPNSEEFYVRNINYATQQIQVNDPNDCLPKRLMNINFKDSPFMATYSHNHTFISCPSQTTNSQFIPIGCLSNSTYSVSAIPSANLNNSLPKSCSAMKGISIPIARRELYDENLENEFNGSLQLEWNVPDCSPCETNHQLCTTHGIGNPVTCSLDPEAQAGNSTDKGRHDKIIKYKEMSLGGIVVLMLVLAFLLCILCRRRTKSSSDHTILSDVEMSPETIVFGEGRSVPEPNNGKCSICLAKYKNKEKLKIIPGCNHCFHVDCIDKWLRTNTTCPVCRNNV